MIGLMLGPRLLTASSRRAGPADIGEGRLGRYQKASSAKQHCCRQRGGTQASCPEQQTKGNGYMLAGTLVYHKAVQWYPLDHFVGAKRVEEGVRLLLQGEV